MGPNLFVLPRAQTFESHDKVATAHHGHRARGRLRKIMTSKRIVVDPVVAHQPFFILNVDAGGADDKHVVLRAAV